jgi:hypothetical protein
MERLGEFPAARDKVLAHVKRLVTTAQRIAAGRIGTIEEGIAILKELRAATYEDLNQIPHEFMVLCAAEWLINRKRCPGEAVWSWNPRQTGGADEPDLRGEFDGAVIVSAEITTSTSPQGVIDTRMRKTLQKLSSMAGERFYFTASQAMCLRAKTKIARAGWQIEAVHLPDVAKVR